MKTLMTVEEPATQVDAAFRSMDGRSIPVEISAVRFDWKGQPFAQIVAHDLSARTQAEAERQRWLDDIESERDQMRRILEQMPIGVIIAEAPSGRIIFHNLEALRLLRLSVLHAEDYKDYAKFGGTNEDNIPYRPAQYPMARSILNNEVIKAEEMRYRRGDGTQTILSVDSAPIYDPKGRMVLYGRHLHRHRRTETGRGGFARERGAFRKGVQGKSGCFGYQPYG